MRALVVEANPRHAAIIVADLKAEGIRVDTALSGQDALYLVRDYQFDLVLLNLALPDMDGTALISRIRSAKIDISIMALSAIPQVRLKALTVGADDVVQHDIDGTELAARMRAIVRRSRGFPQSLLQVGELTLHVDQHQVTAHGVQVHLTGKEFALLQLLVLRRNMVLTKEAILSHLYGGMDEPEIKIIDVFVCKLRGKLAKAGLPDVISTVWGRGYSVKDNSFEAPVVAGSVWPTRMDMVPA